MKLGKRITTGVAARNALLITSACVCSIAIAGAAHAESVKGSASPDAANTAGAHHDSMPAAITQAAFGVEFTEPLFDEVDGSLWVRGKTYKAQFNADGVTYIPFLGSEAPKNYPVQFSLASMTIGSKSIPLDVAAPVREGNQIIFNRGPVREVYHIGLHSIEQTFVFDQKPGAGDLNVQLRINSDLAMEETANAIKLSNELGGVTYSKAIAADAHQSRTEAPTTLENGNIRITVPRARLASAQYPLVIDPIIGTFAVTTAGACRHPDVAYEAGSDTYFVVWEQTFSQTDGDIYGRRFTRLGVFISQSVIDTTTDNWRMPKVASNRVAQNYMVVAERDFAPERKIYGRTVSATNGSTGAQFPIMTQFNCESPDIGGDPLTVGPTYYLVTYSLPPVSVRVALLESNGTLLNETFVAQGIGHFDVAISKSNGNAPFQTQAWTIVWRQGTSGNTIWGAQYRWNGAVQHGPFQIADGSQLFAPRVSTISNEDIPGGERRYTVVYEHDAVNGGIRSSTMRSTALLAQANLTQLENVNLSLAHLNPFVESSGNSFFLLRRESNFAGSWKAYLSSYCSVPSPYRVAEQHRFIGDTATNNGSTLGPVSLAGVRPSGGAFDQFMVVWVTPDMNINAGIGFAKPSCCISDVNGDGVTNVADLLNVISNWGGCDSCAADANGDGAVNVSDLLTVISGWGPCL